MPAKLSLKAVKELVLLRQALTYDPETGFFHWKNRGVGGGRIIMPGDVAGTLKDGYIQIGFRQKIYRAHILAWRFMTGDKPPGELDHADRNRSNNQWDNLRIRTRSRNNHNASPTRANKSGVRGVSWSRSKQRWHARINLDGKVISLGDFANFEDAVAARQQGEIKYLGEIQNTYVPDSRLRQRGRKADRVNNIRKAWSDSTMRQAQSARLLLYHANKGVSHER